jgi:hypothetical protein
MIQPVFAVSVNKFQKFLNFFVCNALNLIYHPAAP